MCLTIITSTEKEEIEGEGWKVVKETRYSWPHVMPKELKIEDCFQFPLANISVNDFLYNTWLERQVDVTEGGSEIPIFCANLTCYPCGFHVIPNKDEAVEYMKPFPLGHVLVKVKYRNVLARGKQDNVNCIVTQFLYVEKPDISHEDISMREN